MGLIINILKPKKTPQGKSVKVEFSGKVGSIDVKGYSYPIHLGLDKLDVGLMRSSLLINRADGSGKSVPIGTQMKIEREVLNKLEAHLKKREEADVPARRIGSTVFYEIFVKRQTLSKNEIIRLFEKYPGLWSNGTVLRTKVKGVARQVKKDLMKSYGSDVYIQEKE